MWDWSRPPMCLFRVYIFNIIYEFSFCKVRYDQTDYEGEFIDNNSHETYLVQYRQI
jgi:hypothetical protein